VSVTAADPICTDDVEVRSRSLAVSNDKIGGRLKQFFPQWRCLTSDWFILDSVQHYNIEFAQTPEQESVPKEINFTPQEQIIIEEESSKLLRKGVITEASHCRREYISTTFARPKKDGGHRLILNLKQLNAYVEYHHFKMDTLQSAVRLMKPNCYMASVDLGDA